MTVTSAEKEVERLLRKTLPNTMFAGKAFSVGGFNRDAVLGLDSKDLDIVVEMKDGARKITEFLHGMFPECTTTPHQMGASYPIWQITFTEDFKRIGEHFQTKGAVIEFADTMKETFPDEDSRQREVQFGTLAEDIERRDFTVNMLLKDMTTGEWKDITGVSIADIKKGILRGHPNISLDKIFNDDPLRMLRLVRFHAKFGWEIPLSVLKCVKRNADRIKIVSAERIMGELEKVMNLGKLHKAVRLMDITGLLVHIFPEVVAMKGCKQHPKHHSEGDAFVHTMLVLKNAPKNLEGQMSALLHDIGKPATQEIKPENITFYGHEDVGAEMAESLLYRLKFDAKTIKSIKTLVKLHMRPFSLAKATEKGLRKFEREFGSEVVDAVLDLGEADALGSFPPSGVPHNHIPELRARFKEIRESAFSCSNKPVLDGKEITNILNVKPGPIIGQVIEFLKEHADELASQRKHLTKEEAVVLVKKRFLNAVDLAG